MDYPKKTQFVIPELLLCNVFFQWNKRLQGCYAALVNKHLHVMRYQHNVLVQHESIALNENARGSSRIAEKKALVDEIARLVKKNAVVHEGVQVLCQGTYAAALDEACVELKMHNVVVRSFDALKRVHKQALFVVRQHRAPALLRYACATLLGLLIGLGVFNVYTAPTRRAYTRARAELTAESTKLIAVQKQLVGVRAIEDKKNKQNLYALLERLITVVDSSFVLERIALQKTGGEKYTALIAARAKEALAVLEALKNAKLFSTLVLEQVKKNRAVEYFTLKGGL